VEASSEFVLRSAYVQKAALIMQNLVCIDLQSADITLDTFSNMKKNKTHVGCMETVFSILAFLGALMIKSYSDRGASPPPPIA
jgi:hypothetical protein